MSEFDAPEFGSENAMRISSVFRGLAARAETAAPHERVSFGDMIEALAARAYGLTLLVFALPACLPMPPGVPMVCGLGILIVALQYPMDGDRLRLPRFVEKRSVLLTDFRRLAHRMLPWLEWLEGLCRPRYRGLFTAPVRLVTGILLALLGFLMFLPIPFLGNMPPAFATVVIAVGIAERDGAVLAAGLALATLASAITLAATAAAIAGVAWVV